MLCATCSESVSDYTLCSSCQKQNCFHCSNVTEAGFRKLGVDRKAVWKCPTCRTAPPPSQEADIAVILRKLDEVTQKLDQIPKLISDFNTLKSDIQDLKESCQFTSEKVVEFSASLDGLSGRVKSLENLKVDVDTFRSDLTTLQQDGCNRDQLSRMNNVEIKGIPYKSGENLFTIVENVAKFVDYPFPRNQINYISRFPVHNSKDKSILLSFVNRYIKEEFIAAARFKKSLLSSDLGFSNTNTKVFINDHLTAANKKLLTQAKTRTNEKNYKYIWVKFAKIHIRKNDQSPVIIINTANDLNKIN